MLTNTTEIETATLPRRRLIIPAPTDVSPSAPRRPPRFPALAWAALALLGLLAHPSPAAAQTDVWTATLTAADLGRRTLGCDNSARNFQDRCSTSTVLSDDDFTHESTDYTVTALTLRGRRVTLTVDEDITTATNALSLDVDGTSLSLADAAQTSNRTRTWTTSALSWTDGTDVSVSLTATSDTTLPVLTSATVSESGENIALVFTEDVQQTYGPPASAFAVTVGGSAVTVTDVLTSNLGEGLIAVAPPISQGQAVVVTYTDPTTGDDANAIQDAAGNDAASFTTGSDGVAAVANESTVANKVPANWSLAPTGLAVGAKFRLLFLSSTKRDGSSTDIADYNTFVQGRAAAGHASIQAYGAGFRAVGCTSAVDARDNTGTTYTTTDRGIPIYWLDGAKAVDDYEDFYDGSWDDEANDTNESGTDAHDTSQSGNYPFTGCANDGTEEFAGATRSRALGAALGFVRIGRLNTSGNLQDPLDGNDTARTTDTRPMYGLSAVFEVVGEDTTPPTLTSAVVTDTGLVIELEFSENLQSSNLPPASAFTVTAGGAAVTVSAVAAGTTPDGFQISVSPLIAQDQAVVVTYADPTTGDDANAIQDTVGNDTPDFTTGSDGVPAVTNNSTVPTAVPANWSLKPTGLTVGDQFRLLFLSSTKRDGSSTDIADYNTFVQARAAAGHVAIQAYSADFRVVGCTEDTDARDNTSTTYTSTDKGVPIYWLNGAKAADQYEDFYDGSWDDVVNSKNESGTAGLDTLVTRNSPWTGCEHDGTEAFGVLLSRALGAAFGFVRIGRPKASPPTNGPLSSNQLQPSSVTLPLYGLSAVFQVAAAVSINNPPAFSGTTADRSVAENTAAGQNVGAVVTATDADSDTLTYTLEGADATSFDMVTTAASAQIRTKTGVIYNHEAQSSYTVIVKADDGNGGTATVTVTITVTDVNEPPGRPEAPSVSATAGSDTSLDVSWTAPSNTGPAIASYDLQYRQGASGDFTNGPQDVTGTSAAIGSLAPGTAYQVQVRATNAEGDGDWSFAGTGQTLTFVPGAPTALSAAASGSTRINLSWTAPASDGGSAITGYRIEVSSDGGATWTDRVANTGITTTYAHTGLAAGDTRHYRVSAINTHGAGAPSDVANATTETTVPGAPTALSAAASGSTRINLSWTAPASDGGSAITGYRIEVSSDGGATWTDRVANTGITTTTYEHPSLAAVTTRHYRVSAINTHGAGAPSDVANATTETTVPGAPTALSAAASGSTRINLSWTAPASDGGSAITGYKIEVSPNGTSGWTDRVANTGITTTYAHTGLAAGTTRHYRVSAINTHGAGTASNVANATTGQTTVPLTLTSADVEETNGLSIYLEFSEDLQLSNPPPASAFTLTVDGSAVTGFSVAWQGRLLPQNAIWLVLPTAIRQGQVVVVTYEDPTAGDDANAIQDTAGNDAATFTTGMDGVLAVTNNSTVTNTVPADWSLIPTGLSTGDKFRLLFLSSTKRNASSTDIADYNTFIQTRAAAGHADIQDYSADFRAVGCTADTDARDNTKTTYTTTDKGVPIYWLNGAKAADQYEDFYDGSWDDEANDKNESGTNGPDTSVSANRPITGCGHDGTEAFNSGNFSRALGADSVRLGQPNRSGSGDGPLSSDSATSLKSITRPMYGLSAVFEVAAAVVVPNNPPAFSADTAARSVAENTAAGQNVGAALTATDADSDTLTYTLEGTDAASFDIVSGSGQIRTRTGVTYNHEAKSTHTVVVKADDGNGGTDTVTVTITVTDVDEPPGQPAAPSVSATAESTTSLDVTWTAPTNTGPAIASYDLQYRAGTSGNFTNGPQNVTGTSAAIGSLAADTSYEVQVRATNAEGDGDWSVAGTGRTTATSAPGAPTGLSATASGTTAIDLSWSAPGSTGGSAITGYKIEVSPNGTSGWTDQVANTNSTATTYAHTGLGGGTTRHYRVSAINTNGAGTASNVANATTDATAPGAPTGLTATASGTTAIDLSWSAPGSTGGSAITGYKIEVSPNGISSWTNLVANTNSTATTYAHTGLAAGATRHYRVSAINTNGTGTASNVDSATTGTSVPGAPTGLSATASGTTAINLSWSAPASTGGSAITGYKIEVSPNGTSGWTDQVANTNSTATTYAHTGLGGGTTRHYRVSAINTNGAGTASNVDSATTDATAPGAPTGLSATASGTTAINLSWSAPASTGGSAITGYKIEVSSDGGSSWSDLVANTSNTTTTYAHTGLAAGTTRHYRVSAINTNGAGTASNVDSATTGTSVPGAPTGLTATASGTTAINLSWTAPGSTGGSAITGYRIEVSSNGTSSWTNLVANTGNANTTYAHTGLTAGATRHYRVSAINANGTGVPSNVANATTGATAPGAPTGLTATASGTTAINLSWSAPGSTGGSAITGYRIEVSSNGGSSWTNLVANTSNTTTTYAHTGLTAGATRHYRVSAINTNGTGTASNVANATTGQTTVTFGASSYTAAEGGATATVAVQLSAAASATVTIPLTKTHRGGATAADYSGVPSNVTFTAGQTRRTFTVTATDDADKDGGESVQLGFGTLPAGYAPGARRTATVTLVDDDATLIVNFGTERHTTVKVRESDTVWHRFIFSLSTNRYGPPNGNPQQPVTIPLVVTHRGGATPADYEVRGWRTLTSVTFGVGESVTSFSMRAIPDGRRETGEGLRLDFGRLPAGVRAGTWGPYETIAFVDQVLPGYTVLFGAEAYTATEGGAPARVSIHLSEPVEIEPLVVRLVVTHVGATAADYTGIPKSVRFEVGEQTQTITVKATDDTDDDDGESVTLSFVNDPNGRVRVRTGPASATVALADNDGLRRVTVSFGAVTYTATEGGADATVRVELDAAPGRSVTVPLTKAHLGNATAADYSGIPMNVTFAANQTSRTFAVMATAGDGSDGGESVSIGFGTLPEGVFAGSPAATTVTLADGSEQRLVVNFGSSRGHTVQVREGARRLRLNVLLDSSPRRPVTIPLVVTHVGGATEADYAAIPESVTFAAGQTSAHYYVRALPDEEDETGEGLQLDFGPLPPGVRKGTWGPYETIDFLDPAPAANLSVYGTVVTVGFPGALDGGSTPSPRDFVVSVEAPGGEKAMAPVAVVALEGSDVFLQLARPVASDDTVTLSYLADAMHPIRDEAGSPAAPLTDAPVRNQTPASGLGPEAGLRVQAGCAAEKDRVPKRRTVMATCGLAGGTQMANPAPLAALLEAAQVGAGTGRLDLSSRHLTDITALAGLTGLRELDLRDNAIEDLWPLAGLRGLEALYLSGNQISDLRPLAGLRGLKVLDLAGNRIEDLWPLSGLSELRELDLADNAIEDLRPLARLTRLEVLLLDRNRITDVLALSPMAELANLGLAGNPIANLWPLEGLGQLHRLDLSGNAAADPSALGRVENLRWLWLDPAPAAELEAAPGPDSGPRIIVVEQRGGIFRNPLPSDADRKFEWNGGPQAY